MQEVSKSQNIRLIDVLFIGPYLLYLGYKGKIEDYDKGILFLLGVATIGYNLKNYLVNKEVQQEKISSVMGVRG